MQLKLLGNLKRGLLFIISAPAGTGKTTLAKMLKEEFPCVVTSVSYTTRSPRGEEVDGVDYTFVSIDQFLQLVKEGGFLEYVQLYNNYYGTSRSWVENALSQGKHVLLVIDTQGALKVMEKVPAVPIFVSPPSIEELGRRLRDRGMDSEEVIRQRLDWAERELKAQNAYHYVILNDDLDIAYQILRSILIAEEHKNR